MVDDRKCDLAVETFSGIRANYPGRLGLLQSADPKRALRHRTVIAILAGGNVTVPTRQEDDATFRYLPRCTSPPQTGCVIALLLVSRRAASQHGLRPPGQGISNYSGRTALALGNFIADVRGEETAYQTQH
jgi:hypothetical protein